MYIEVLMKCVVDRVMGIKLFLLLPYSEFLLKTIIMLNLFLRASSFRFYHYSPVELLSTF